MKTRIVLVFARAGARSAVRVPLFEIGQRVEGGAALVPAGWAPHLEMEVAALGVAGFADHADRLPGADGVAGVQRRGFGQVGVHEVVAGAAAVDHDVVAGRALVTGVLDDAATGGDQRRPAGGHHVLALVGVTGAAGPEAAGAHPVFVRAEDREGVTVEGETEAEGGRGRRLAGGRRGGGRGLRADLEAVAAVAGGPAFVGGPVPADFVFDVGGDVLAVEGLDDFARFVDDAD